MLLLELLLGLIRFLLGAALFSFMTSSRGGCRGAWTR